MFKTKSEVIETVITIGCMNFFPVNGRCDASVTKSPSLEIKKIGEVRTGGAPTSIQIKDDLLYVADHLGLLIYDVSDPSMPQKVGENLDGGTGHDISVTNSF